MKDSASLIRSREVPQAVLRQLAAAGSLYAVVDSCNAPMVPRKVMEMGPLRAVSLYRGTAEEQYWNVAPYLLAVDEPLLDWILSEETKAAWGIFIGCRSDIETVRHHLRHFLKVRAPEKEVWNFRFYDPRVLKPFLGSCSTEDLRLFFGPVAAFGIVDPKVKDGIFYMEATPRPAAVAPVVPTRYPLVFQLRDPHLEALKPQADNAAVEEMITFLRDTENTGIEGVPDDLLRPRVLAGLLRARKYGFTRKSSIGFFIATMFNSGKIFDEHSKIHAALTDSSIHPDVRVDAVFDSTSDLDWDEAEKNSDAVTWKTVCEREGVDYVE